MRELARSILEKEVDVPRLRAAEASPDGVDEALWARLAEANLLGLALPEAHGGLGFGFLELCSFLEELGRCLAPAPVLPTLVLGALPIAAFGTEAQQARWLPEVAGGRVLLSAALQDAGSADPGAPAARARAEAGGWRLDGAKREVPGARRAARLLVPASTPEGVAVFLVDPAARGVELAGGPSLDGRAPVRPAPRRRSAGARRSTRGARAGRRRRRKVDPRARPRGERGAPARGLRMRAAPDRGVRARARAVRRADRLLPGGAAPLRRRLHRPRGAALVQLASGVAARGGAPRGARGGGRKVLGRRGRLAHRERGAPPARGLGSDVDYPIQRYFLWSKALELGFGGAAPQLAWLGKDMARTGPKEAS